MFKISSYYILKSFIYVGLVFLLGCSNKIESKKLKDENIPVLKNLRILIVDDHPVVRQGVTSLINMEPDLIVCAEAENADQALKILKEETINLAIVDISLNGTNGIQLTQKINAKYPNLPVLFAFQDLVLTHRNTLLDWLPCLPFTVSETRIP